MYEEKITSSLPIIRRARDFHVYDTKGTRYLDLFRANGQALMGHKPKGIPLVLKNTFSKGLFASYPSVYSRRLEKILTGLLPGCSSFRIYRNYDRAKALLGDQSVRDPLYHDVQDAETALWRPFLDENTEKAYTDTEGNPLVILPVLPFPGDFLPAVMGIKKGYSGKLPPSDRVSPVLEAVLIRTVYEMQRFAEEYNEDLWKKFPLPFWKRKGPYLLPAFREDKYKDIFTRCLKNRVLVSPYFSIPSIVPGEWSDGEIGFLKNYRG